MDEQYKCTRCWLFIKESDVKFKGEKKIPHCPGCGDAVNKVCPNDHCHCSHPVTFRMEYCELCGEAMCPECKSHDVAQLSRVTGYIQFVGGFNAAKQQEVKDRTRYGFNGGTLVSIPRPSRTVSPNL